MNTEDTREMLGLKMSYLIILFSAAKWRAWYNMSCLIILFMLNVS
jgi:hypothetical protein